MKTLADVIELFDAYRDAPSTVNGHKLLQRIKSGELQTVLQSVQLDLEEAEHDKIFNPNQSQLAVMRLDKYQQILQIVMGDCLPMAQPMAS